MAATLAARLRAVHVHQRGQEGRIRASIDYTRGRIALSQSLFVIDLLEKFAPQIIAGHSRKFGTPADDSLKFNTSQSPTLGSGPPRLVAFS